MSHSEHVVLIGEPDHATSALYRRTLGSAFEVRVAADGDAVLDALHKRTPAVLVLELAMFPAMSARELDEIGAVCATIGVPLVICSTQDERRRGKAAGAAAYLIKPTLPRTLLETVRHILHRPQPAIG